jgi:fatty acid desaturase
MTTQEYLKVLRPRLPPHVFAASPWRLVNLSLHVSLFLLGAISFQYTTEWLWPFSSIMMGHTLAVIAFHAHDLSHGVMIKNHSQRMALETFFWALIGVPATVWRQTHNRSHHLHASTIQDPDRPYVASEKSAVTSLYVTLFYPAKILWFRNPLCLLHFVTYAVRQTLTALYPAQNKPAIATAKPSYSRSQKIQILGEIAFIAGLQWCIFELAGGSFSSWIWAGIIPLFGASAVAMLYIFTNHFLNPISHSHDPVAGTTSVIVPRWMDWLHDNFSYHTEHHLFPQMDPKHYPLVSDLLMEHFPERYSRISLRRAWKRLWQQPAFRGLASAPQNPTSP